MAEGAARPHRLGYCHHVCWEQVRFEGSTCGAGGRSEGLRKYVLVFHDTLKVIVF